MDSIYNNTEALKTMNEFLNKMLSMKTVSNYYNIINKWGKNNSSKRSSIINIAKLLEDKFLLPKS